MRRGRLDLARIHQPDSDAYANGMPPAPPVGTGSDARGGERGASGTAAAFAEEETPPCPFAPAGRAPPASSAADSAAWVNAIELKGDLGGGSLNNRFFVIEARARCIGSQSSRPILFSLSPRKRLTPLARLLARSLARSRAI